MISICQQQVIHRFAYLVEPIARTVLHQLVSPVLNPTLLSMDPAQVVFQVTSGTLVSTYAQNAPVNVHHVSPLALPAQIVQVGLC